MKCRWCLPFIGGPGMRHTTIVVAAKHALLAATLCIAIGRAAGAQDSASVAPAEPLVITPDFANDAWVEGNQPIGLRLSRPLDLKSERLAVVVGHTDLSALFTVTPTTARYAANTLRLPSGETELVAYIVAP